MFAPPALLFLMKQSQQIWYFVCKHAKYCLSLGTLVKRNKPPTSLGSSPSLNLSLSPAGSPPSIAFLWSLFLVCLVRFLLLLGLGLGFGAGADGSGGCVLRQKTNKQIFALTISWVKRREKSELNTLRVCSDKRFRWDFKKNAEGNY